MRTHHRLLSAVVIGSLFAIPLVAQDKIPGVGPAGPVKKVHTGFQFTEGPAADKQGNIYFTDIPAEKIHKVDLKGELSTFREKSNHANGLMFVSDEEIAACEMDGQIVLLSLNGKRRMIAEKYDGKRFNAPNDLVADKAGGVYFTDPAFRAPKELPQGKTAVYYVDAKGVVTRLIDNLPNPNGVILSPDEKTLYVIPSGQAEMMSYAIEAPGKIGKGKVFCTLKQAEGKKAGGGDGLTVDVKGNLYITSALGLQVFAADGKALGIIAFPEQPSNCTFGGKDFKMLYATARTSLYAVEMEVAGHQFSGKK